MSETLNLSIKGVLSYPYVFEPNRDGKFEVTVLIDKKDEKTKRALDLAVKAASEEGMKGVWKGIKPASWSPVKDGDGTRENGNPYGEECRGKWVLRASSKFRPAVLGPDKSPVESASDVYGGCLAVVNVDFFPYSTNGRKGVSAGLVGVWKIRDGKRFGGRSAEEVFSGMNISDFLDDDDDLFG